MKKQYLIFLFLIFSLFTITIIYFFIDKPLFNLPKLKSLNILKKSKISKTKTLNIFSYSSFTNPWGAGPILKKKFEEKYNCNIVLLDGGSGQIFLESAKIRKNKNNIDLILGIDQFLITKANNYFNFLPAKINKTLFNSKIKDSLPTNNFLIPFNWAPLTFLTNSPKKKSIIYKNIDHFFSKIPKKSITLQDPHTSSPGFTFLLWLTILKGEKNVSSFLKKHSNKIHSIHSSWSKSYGIFQKKLVDYTFSYLTSPIFHWKTENNYNIQPVLINEDYLFQIEYVGIPSICKNCDLARKFINFMLSKEGQNVIMYKNFMFSVIDEPKKNTFFNKLPEVNIIDPKIIKNFINKKASLLKTWENIFQ